MKRLCKDIDITDRDLISRAVYECLDRKYKRNDTMRYMSQITGIKEGYIRYIYHRYGKRAMYPITEIIVTELREELLRGNISFPPIYYREKIDASSRKKEYALPREAPTGAHDMYKAGEYMIWTDGTVRRCKADTDRGPDVLPDNWETVE